MGAGWFPGVAVTLGSIQVHTSAAAATTTLTTTTMMIAIAIAPTPHYTEHRTSDG